MLCGQWPSVPTVARLKSRFQPFLPIPSMRWAIWPRVGPVVAPIISQNEYVSLPRAARFLAVAMFSSSVMVVFE